MAHGSFEIPALLKCWFARLATLHAWKCSFRTNFHHNQKQVIGQKCIWFNFQGLVSSRDFLFQHLKQLSVAAHGLIQVSLLSQSQNGPRELFCSLFAFQGLETLGSVHLLSSQVKLGGKGSGNCPSSCLLVTFLGFWRNYQS